MIPRRPTPSGLRQFAPPGLHDQTRDWKVQSAHPAENILAGVLSLWLVFQPWAFGLMHVWSQGVALGLAAIAFLLSLWPRTLEAVPGMTGPVKTAPWRTLIALPVFWLTLALFSYVAIQALNPAWSFRSSATHWWLEKNAHLGWLPSGIEAPFAGMNGWRRLFMWASPFLAGCALWIGITHRRSVRLLVVIFATNATLVGLYAMIQQFAGTRKVFWHFDFPAAAGPYGSFIYKNHAAAFLLLGIGAMGGLAWHFYLRGTARGARSTPAPVAAFACILLLAAAGFSLSLLGLIIGVGAALMLFFAGLWLAGKKSVRIWSPMLGALVLLGGAAWGVLQLDRTAVEGRVRLLQEGIRHESPALRFYAADATLQMLRDHPLYGIGAGGFRHLAPLYLQQYPATIQIVHFGMVQRQAINYRMNETHSEPLQFAAELGLVGGTILLLMLACGLAAVSPFGRRRHPLGMAAGITAGSLGLFAIFDFPLHNGAVLGGLVFLVVAASRWADLESPR